MHSIERFVLSSVNYLKYSPLDIPHSAQVCLLYPFELAVGAIITVQSPQEWIPALTSTCLPRFSKQYVQYTSSHESGSLSAVIVAVSAAFAVTLPLLTVATFVFEDVHVTIALGFDVAVRV